MCSAKERRRPSGSPKPLLPQRRSHTVAALPESILRVRGSRLVPLNRLPDRRRARASPRLRRTNRLRRLATPSNIANRLGRMRPTHRAPPRRRRLRPHLRPLLRSRWRLRPLSIVSVLQYSPWPRPRRRLRLRPSSPRMSPPRRLHRRLRPCRRPPAHRMSPRADPRPGHLRLLLSRATPRRSLLRQPLRRAQVVRSAAELRSGLTPDNPAPPAWVAPWAAPIVPNSRRKSVAAV